MPAQPKKRDPLSIPTVIFPFEDVRFRYIYVDEMDIKSVVDSIAATRVKPGDLVWLSDGETRIQATIEPRDGQPGRIQAKVHWATQEQVPYPLD